MEEKTELPKQLQPAMNEIFKAFGRDNADLKSLTSKLSNKELLFKEICWREIHWKLLFKHKHNRHKETRIARNKSRLYWLEGVRRGIYLYGLHKDLIKELQEEKRIDKYCKPIYQEFGN